jgi:hypothetical protein
MVLLAIASRTEAMRLAVLAAAALTPCLRHARSAFPVMDVSPPPPPPTPPPPPPLSRTLLLGDSGALLVYFLGLSTMRTLASAFESGFDPAADVLDMNLKLTVEYIEIEQLSAIAITLAWLVGAAAVGALSPEWIDMARQAQRDAPVLGIPRTLVRAWLTAVPLPFVAKAIAAAAIILPVGGWLALDAPTAVGDLGGMLAAVALWRTVLLVSIL